MLRLELKSTDATRHPWVARITGIGGYPYFHRVFLRPSSIFFPSGWGRQIRTYHLETHQCYESFEPGHGRNFFSVQNGEMIPITTNQLENVFL